MYLNKYNFETLDELKKYVSDNINCTEEGAIATLFEDYSCMKQSLKIINSELIYLINMEIIENKIEE